MNIDITPPHPMPGPPQTGPGGVGGHGVVWGDINIHIDININIDIHIIININIEDYERDYLLFIMYSLLGRIPHCILPG